MITNNFSARFNTICWQKNQFDNSIFRYFLFVCCTKNILMSSFLTSKSLHLYFFTVQETKRFFNCTKTYFFVTTVPCFTVPTKNPALFHNCTTTHQNFICTTVQLTNFYPLTFDSRDDLPWTIPLLYFFSINKNCTTPQPR